MPEPAKKTPAKKPAANPAAAFQPQPDPLPTHKDDLAALAIAHGIPSYEAWAMTVPELTDKLEG